MNQTEMNRWLEPSPPIAVDSAGRAAPAHDLRVRDLRVRFGDPESYTAQCECGWTGEPRAGRFAERAARRDGVAHIEGQLADCEARVAVIEDSPARREVLS